MKELKITRLTLLLSSISGVILLLLSTALSWIGNRTYEALGEIVGFKWLLVVAVLAILAFIFLYAYHRLTIQLLITSVNKAGLVPRGSDVPPKPEISDQDAQEMLGGLSKEEKEFLLRYIEEDTKTQYSSILNGVATGLMAQGILFNPTGLARYDKMAFNLQPWVWDYLKKHPRLLK